MLLKRDLGRRPTHGFADVGVFIWSSKAWQPGDCCLTGTRSGVDICELPSQLMEYWVRDPGTLQQLARHHRTGEPMPAGLARGAVAGLSMFAALDLQQQVRCRARLDGSEPPAACAPFRACERSAFCCQLVRLGQHRL
jgi:hypothetical protein